MNNLTIIGNVTKDTNLRTVVYNGVKTPVLNFTVAVNDGYRKDKDGNTIGVEFFRVAAWRGAATTLAKYLHKGRQIGISGAVHLGNYKDPNTKERVYQLEIPKVAMFELLGEKDETEKKVMNDMPEGAEEVIAESDPVEEAPVTEENDDLPW